MELPADIVWEKFTSLKGAEYEVGYSPQAETNDHDVQAQNGGGVLASGPSFGINVDWPVAFVGGQDQWKDTTPEVNRVARIPRYNLFKYGGSIYAYMFQFVNEDTYHYYFHDAEGDSYSVNTWKNRSHYFRYNSNKPTIIHVSGN